MPLQRIKVDWISICHFFGMGKYEPWILDLQNYDGFSRQYLKMAGYGLKYKEAYESTENLHEQYFGTRKYSNYESFKTIRSREG